MKFRSLWHLSELSFFILDYVLMCAAVVCALILSPRYESNIWEVDWLRAQFCLVTLVLPLCMSLGLQLAGLQRVQLGFRAIDALVKSAIGVAVGMAVFVIAYAILQYELVGRFILGIGFVYGVSFVRFSRLIVWKMAMHNCRNIIIYGGSRAFRSLSEVLAKSKLPIVVDGYTSLLGEGGCALGFINIGNSGLLVYCKEKSIREVVVESPARLVAAEREVLVQCMSGGICVMDLGHFTESNLGRVDLSGLGESWFWGYDGPWIKPGYSVVKRVAEFALSLLGLILFAPLALIVALLIKLEDGGSVFYSQIRTGQHGVPFRIFKLRTMRHGAEEGGALWASDGDARVTRIGRILRKSRVDEVPQFWNIIKNEMSLIGPRPERPELVARVEREVPFYNCRHLIKPGLTGWAQINYPYGASIEDAREKLAFDLYYIKHASITVDSLILLRTIVAMVSGAR